MQSKSNSFRNPKEVLLKQVKWQSIDNGFKTLNFTVHLLEGQKNAKHQKLTLSIEVVCQSQSIKFYQKYKTSDLPSQAITIFYDVQNLYEYIEEYCKDTSRIKFNPNDNSFIVVNVVVMKSKQIKQQIYLTLLKQRYINQKLSQSKEIIEQNSFLDNSRISEISKEQILEESKNLFQSLIKERNCDLEGKITFLTEHLNNFVQEIKLLKDQNKVLKAAVNSCNATVFKLQKESAIISQKISNLQKQKSGDMKKQQIKNPFSQVHEKKLGELQKKVEDHKWHIDQINNSFENIIEEHGEIKKMKTKFEQQSKSQSRNDQYLPIINEIRKEVFVLSAHYVELKQNSTRLGEKIHVNLDTNSNKYIDNFRIVQNIIQKISGDQQRHQFLGKQNVCISELKRKCYFELKIVSTVNSGIVIGIVSQARKNQRHSYDKKQCVCYDGKGFIFEQGYKIKMPCKFDNGQTIRVVLDPAEGNIHWYVGFTQVGSAFIPESLKKVRVVPYFELYDVNDKVAING